MAFRSRMIAVGEIEKTGTLIEVSDSKTRRARRAGRVSAGIVLSSMGCVLYAAAASPAAGIINCVKGDVTVDGATVRQGGTATGHVIRTFDGMAEILLGPGAFLRLDDRSELVLHPEALPGVQASLERGAALLEVLDASSRELLNLEQKGVIARIDRPGLYYFNRAGGTVTIYEGSARLTKAGKEITVQKGFGARTRNLHAFPAVPDTVDDLYVWSNFRSEQLSLESASSAQLFAGDPKEWHGPGWYWNPWSSAYTFLSATGSLNSPFGWPFYAPGFSHNAIPVNRGGDSFLYGPPAGRVASPAVPAAAAQSGNSRPAVPLTAPGVPTFPNNRPGRP